MAEQIFIVGGEVEPPYFIGRDEEVSRIRIDLLSRAQHNVIIGPRRIGKTSLLKNLKNSIEDEVLFVQVNCRKITHPTDFFRITTRAMVDAYEEKHRVKGLARKFSDIFRATITGATRSIAEIGGSIEHIGQIYLRFRESEVSESELIEETFAFIGNFADEIKEQIIIAFDEFQELSRFNPAIFSLFKTHMDNRPDVRYIFSGSSVALLNKVFLKPDSPLYLMAAKVRLEPIGQEAVSRYIRSRLLMQNITISDDALDTLYNYTDGFPFYFQKMGFLLYQHAILEERDFVTLEDTEVAFSTMLDEFDSEFESRYSCKFSRQQQDILKYLSAEKTRRLKEIAADMGTPSSSLTASMRDLTNTMTIDKPGEGRYGILDAVFRIWIARNILGNYE